MRCPMTGSDVEIDVSMAATPIGEATRQPAGGKSETRHRRLGKPIIWDAASVSDTRIGLFSQTEAIATTHRTTAAAY